RELRGLETEMVRAGVSPHAPYTVSAPQLGMISRLAIEEKLPLMMHAAESKAEQLFLAEGRGPFADGLKQRSIPWKAPGVSTIRYLDDCGVLAARPLLAHCINVDEGDLQLIKAAGAGIAHCPKSNAKLRHGHAPFTKFIQSGISVGLGSDSMASNNCCDILEEARFATLMGRVDSDGRESETEVCATTALFAATLGGARALGVDHQVGALAAGMQADITVVGLGGAHQQPLSNPVDALIFSSSGRDVLLTMVSGKEIYRNQRISSVAETEIRELAANIRNKLDGLA
ncbi:MAG TPA: amidohydrolase family protein, partial [Pyrinomonadaceae bacterium]|nr:amidohydrolase family protein [Pyrinomonadaceae bacterium]